jgi:glycine cleavage system H protein
VAASGAVRVGFDDLVCQALGRGDRLVLLSPGDRVTQGEPMVVLEQGRRGITLTAPVSGEIVEVNPALREIPKSLDVSPYEGWVYALKPSRLGEEISRLRLAETAEAWLQEQLRLFSDWARNRTSLTAQAALADGGLPVRGCLAHLDDAAWEEFQREFLGVHEPVAQPSSDERRRP